MDAGYGPPIAGLSRGDKCKTGAWEGCRPCRTRKLSTVATLAEEDLPPAGQELPSRPLLSPFDDGFLKLMMTFSIRPCLFRLDNGSLDLVMILSI